MFCLIVATARSIGINTCQLRAGRRRASVKAKMRLKNCFLRAPTNFFILHRSPQLCARFVGSLDMILIVGLACIDEILIVEKYPAEDLDTRVMERRVEQGGNAANISTVLAQFSGVEHELFAALPDDSRLERRVRSDARIASAQPTFLFAACSPSDTFKFAAYGERAALVP